jgi:tetratricopeptide (TPR) repeat protein
MMKNFDFEAGKRFREEGDIVEALRCFRSALDEDRNAVETYVELALTYIMAFEDSGDPLCLDSARKVCLAGLRREPTPEERRRLFEIQDRIEDLLLESQKAEADAMADAMEDGAFSGAVADAAAEPYGDGGDDPETDAAEEDDLEEERGH